MAKMAKSMDSGIPWKWVEIAIFHLFEVSGDLSGDPLRRCLRWYIYRIYVWDMPKGIPGVYGSTYGVPYTYGIHRWPDTLSEGVRIGSKCGYTGVSSYSRLVFDMVKWSKSWIPWIPWIRWICRYPGGGVDVHMDTPYHGI